MFCRECGAPILEGEKFCKNCGTAVLAEETKEPIEEPSVEEIPAEEPKVEEPKSPYAYVQAPTSSAPVGNQPNTTLWIVLCVLEILFCCSYLPGILGLIFAILAAVKKNKGETEAAMADLKIAKIAFWVGLGLFVVKLVFLILVTVWSAAGSVSLVESALEDPAIGGNFGNAEDFLREFAQEIAQA